MGMQGFYYGGYPWKDFGVLTAADLNAAIAIAIQSGQSGGGSSDIAPGSITNDKLATPWIMFGSTQVQLGQTGANVISGMSDPTNPGDYATKRYVDAEIGNISGGSGSGVIVVGTKATPATGATVNAGAAPASIATISLMLVPAGSLANLTVVAPSLPTNLTTFEISSSQYIDNMTVLAPTGSSITNGGPFSLGAGGGRSWRYYQPDSMWYGRY